MNISTRVSIIMPFLNTEKFIQEAIESVCAQTYDNWELLLVDDGSTDSSTEIALRYAERYPGKVRYLEHNGHQNRGASASRNLGISYAKSEYIALLDADDVWLPHKLEQQVAILDSQPEAAMVYGHSQRWYSWTENPEDIQRDSMYELGVPPDTLLKPPTLLTRFLRGKAAVPCPCSVMVRREIVESIGGFEDAFRYIFTDQVFYAKLCLKAPVFASSQYWAKYRKHSNSSVAIVKKKGQLRSARLTFLNWLEGYLSKQGIKDIEVWQALQEELWPYRHPVLYHLLERVQHPVSQMKRLLKLIVRWTLPVPIRCWLRAQWRGGMR